MLEISEEAVKEDRYSTVSAEERTMRLLQELANNLVEVLVAVLRALCESISSASRGCVKVTDLCGL